jgi:hypothetical protein
LRNLFAENTIERISPFQKLMKEDSITWKLPGVSYHSITCKQNTVEIHIVDAMSQKHKMAVCCVNWRVAN